MYVCVYAYMYSKSKYQNYLHLDSMGQRIKHLMENLDPPVKQNYLMLEYLMP